MNKPIRHFQLGILTPIIEILWLLLSTMLKYRAQCGSKIRLHILCSLILVYTGCKSNCSGERHVNPFPNKPWFLRLQTLLFWKFLKLVVWERVMGWYKFHCTFRMTAALAKMRTISQLSRECQQQRRKLRLSAVLREIPGGNRLVTSRTCSNGLRHRKDKRRNRSFRSVLFSWPFTSLF